MENNNCSNNSHHHRDKAHHKLTLMEKSLLFICIFLLITFLIACIVLICLLKAEKSRVEPEVCITEHCVSTAARIIKSMDKLVDPCEDFFQFSCGGWNRDNPIPDDKSSINTFKILDDELLNNLNVILDQPITNESTAGERNMKNYFKSCLNVEQLDELGVDPLMKVLNNLGGWPVANSSWTERNVDMTEFFLQTKSLPNVYLFKINVSPNERNSEEAIINLDSGQLPLQKNIYLDQHYDKTLQVYRNIFQKIVEVINPDINHNSMDKDIDDVLDFEISLARIHPNEELKRSLRTSIVYSNLDNLTLLFDDIFNFKYVVKKLFKTAEVEINDNETIAVVYKPYFEQLVELLKRTSKRTIVNAYLWEYVLKSTNFMPQQIIQIGQDLQRIIHGMSKEKPRWNYCVSLTNDFYGMTLGRLYVEEHFDAKSKEFALEVLEVIREAFKNLIDDADWMKEETKILAKEKVDAMKENIGYPDYLFNETFRQEEFRELSMKADHFFENYIEIGKFQQIVNFQQLRLKIDKTKWGSYPGLVNAFYNAQKNQITFPAGILQSPFYHEFNPKYLNFGGIGMVIGHELTHGFDDKGKDYDKNGNMKEWWSTDDNTNFQDKTKCIVDQYSKYYFDGINETLNGNLTQGENIADNGGLRQAYLAYKKWSKVRGEEPRLPGLPYTPSQLLFINFGQIWCGAQRPEHAKHLSQLGKHAPGKYRVIGTLVNMWEFAETFNCPLNSPMNPATKCKVWK